MNKSERFKNLVAHIKASMPNILRGIGSVLTIWPARRHYVFIENNDTPEERDARDVASDWREVGDDIRDAMGQIKLPPIHAWDPIYGETILTLSPAKFLKSYPVNTEGLGTRESPIQFSVPVSESPYWGVWTLWRRYRIESVTKKIYIKVNDCVFEVLAHGVMSGDGVFSKLI